MLIGKVAAVSGISSTPLVERERILSAPRAYVRCGWLLCSATLLLVVIALRWQLWHGHTFPGDPWAGRLGESHKPWLVYILTRAYQQVGRPIPAVGEVLVMLWWLKRSAGPRATKGLLIVLLASLTCGLIKTLCGPTPMWVALHHVGSNFPSGVVTFVTATGGYLAVVARRQGRTLAPLVALVVIAGAGPARVLGGQHLLSDALGGYMVGAAWLIVALIYAVPGRGLVESIMDEPEPESALQITARPPAPSRAG